MERTTCCCKPLRLTMSLLLLMTMLIPLTHAIDSDSLSDRIMQNVFHNYRHDLRPLCGDFPYTVHARFGVSVRQLIELDEVHQVVVTSMWIRMRWVDCRLTWNVTDYGGLERITVPRTLVWYPDLTLYDNAESTLGALDEYRISIYHTGEMFSLVRLVLKSTCSLNVRKFPFDTQLCNLTFGSWTYTGAEFNMTSDLEEIDTSSYLQNGQWDLDAVEVHSIAPVFGGKDYTQVIITLQLSRMPLFYAINLLLPSVVIKAIATVGFALPPHSGEKVSLEITVLLSLSVFQLVILRTMPAASDNMPIIAIYYGLAMILVSLSIVMTIVVMNVHFSKRRHGLPRVFVELMRGPVGRMVGMTHILKHSAVIFSKMDKKDNSLRSNIIFENGFSNSIGMHGTMTNENAEDRRNSFMHGDIRVSVAESNGGSRRNNVYAIDQDSILNETEMAYVETTPSSGDQHIQTTVLLHTAQKILRHLQSMKKYKDNKERKDSLAFEWKLFAVFLDRLLIIIFLFLGMTLTISVFLYIGLK